MLWTWLIIIIILALVEIMSINLVTIWFIISGIAALIVSLFTDNMFIQFFVFVILGTILLITTRPILIKLIKPKKQTTNADRIIGMEGVVTEEITKLNNGEVKVDGKKWTAYSNKTIKKGTPIIIKEITGVKVKVEESKE